MDIGKIALALTGVAAIVVFMILSALGYLGPRITPGGAMVTGGLGLVLFLVIYYVADSFLSGADTSRRLNKLSIAAATKFSGNSRRITPRAEYADLYITESDLVQAISRFTKRFLKIEGDRLSEIQTKLLAAGFLSSRALSIYLIFKVFSPLAGLFFGLAIGYLWFGMGDIHMVSIVAASLTLVGFMGPDFVLAHRAKERRAALLVQLPDMIDLMLIYIESGASFDQALQRSLLRMKKRVPVACEELSILERELQVLPFRETAYQNFIERTDLPLVRTVVNVLQQSEKFGTPIGEAFARLSAQTRRDRLMNAEQKAARIPILIMLPVFGFVLPSFMAAVLGPVIIKGMSMFAGTSL